MRNQPRSARTRPISNGPPRWQQPRVRRVLRQNIVNTIAFTMPRGSRATSKPKHAPRRGGRPLGARASRPLVRPGCPRYSDAGLPIATVLPEPGPWGRPVPTGPPAGTEAGAAATRVRRLAAHGSAGVSPADKRTWTRRGAVAARRHAAEPGITEAALHDDRATRRRPGVPQPPGCPAGGLSSPRSQGFHHGRRSTTVFTNQ
jgi:hypothetical protein